jgi:hypothetical protein
MFVYRSVGGSGLLVKIMIRSASSSLSTSVVRSYSFVVRGSRGGHWAFSSAWPLIARHTDRNTQW